MGTGQWLLLLCHSHYRSGAGSLSSLRHTWDLLMLSLVPWRGWSIHTCEVQGMCGLFPGPPSDHTMENST